MAATLKLIKSVTDGYTHFWGRAIFIDGESKNANFDTKDSPLNLSLFKEGSITLKTTDKDDTPTLDVNVVAQDHRTGDWDVIGSFTSRTTNGRERIRITDLTHAMAIDATLAGGSFTITITGEFKRGHKE